MGRPKITGAPKVEIEIGGINVEPDYQVLEWMAMASGGYIMRARILDPYLNFLARMSKESLLPKARKEPLECKFKIGWDGGDEMEEMKAWVTDAAAVGGVHANSETEIVAIDPPSWALNAGFADGKVYKGCVSDVIKRVCDDYKQSSGTISAPNLTKITETKDDKNNKWWMMRQDPKTFIQLLLDWSSSVTKKKTNWVVNAKNDQLHIVEQADLDQNDFKDYLVSRVFEVKRSSDVHEVSVQSDVLMNFWQTKLITQGISAISGKYLDKTIKSVKKKVEVYDENTESKIDAKSTSDESFKKPSSDEPHGGWASDILAVPEHNAGDIGVIYEDYIDGRPRQMFIGQLSLMHRIRLKVDGDADVRDPLGLEATIVNLLWKNEKDEPYWLGGKWIVYGFHHMVTRQYWWTYLYLRRFDVDSSANKR